MTPPPTPDGTLDEVYLRLHETGPEFDGWLSNHGPMAADALLRLGAAPATVHRWVDRYRSRLEPAPGARWRIDPADWREPWGDPSRLGDWLHLFGREVREHPWREVLEVWWPRLLPGAIASATHGLIRTGHAVRAVREEETPARLDELASSLGYWAARWQPVPGDTHPAGTADPADALAALPAGGHLPGGIRTRLAWLAADRAWPARLAALSPVTEDEVPAALDALVDAAVARHPRASAGRGNPLMLVHAATAPRAAALVLPDLPRAWWPATHAAAWTASATITTVYQGSTDAGPTAEEATVEDLLAAVAASGDEHVVKFAETAEESARRGTSGARTAAVTAARAIG